MSFEELARLPMAPPIPFCLWNALEELKVTRWEKCKANLVTRREFGQIRVLELLVMVLIQRFRYKPLVRAPSTVAIPPKSIRFILESQMLSYAMDRFGGFPQVRRSTY